MIKIVVFTPAGTFIAKSMTDAQEYKKMYGYFFRVIREDEPDFDEY